MKLVFEQLEALLKTVRDYAQKNFPRGTPVMVTKAPSYTGPGVVSSLIDASAHILVRIGNGNEWRYPLSTISRLPKDQYPDWIKKEVRRREETKRWIRRQEQLKSDPDFKPLFCGPDMKGGYCDFPSGHVGRCSTGELKTP